MAVLGPGVEVGVGPWALTGWRRGDELPAGLATRGAGAALVAAGVVALVACFARFAADAQGTPSPAAPARRLVLAGPYRVVRNPMYLASAAAIVGEGLLLGRVVLLAAAGAFLGACALWVPRVEEPLLRRRFGPAWERYARAVPRWLPRRSALRRVPRALIRPDR